MAVLIRRLWEPDGKSIVGFLREIIDTIKSTKNSAMAEHGLLMILHSPKVLHDPLEIEGFANVRPGYQAMKLYFDAAGLPVGKARTDTSAVINAISKEVALTEAQIIALLDAVRKDGPDEASAQRAKRARKKLGISRRRGRPKKTDKNSLQIVRLHPVAVW